MKILTLTSVFPNNLEAHLGIFVKQRMFTIGKFCHLKVVAPVYWYKYLKYNFKIPYFEIQEGIEVYHPKFFFIPRFFKFLDGFFFALSALPTLLKIRKNFNFDIIDSHFAYPDGYGAVLIGKILNIPVSITLRGTLERLRKNPVIRRQIRWALKNADIIIAVSSSLKERAVELGIPNRKVTVIRNGIDPKKFFMLDKLDSRKKLGLPLDRRILLSVGGLVERKGFHHVIDVLPEVIREVSDLLYIIIGSPGAEGDMTSLLKKKIEKFNLKEYVRMVGSRPHHELVYWYNASDVFCLFSSKEGCPNVVLESLACGTPVVSSNVGGVPEIIPNDSLGYVINYNKQDLKDALIKAFNKNWNRKIIEKYGQTYTWDLVAQQQISLYEKVLNSRI